MCFRPFSGGGNFGPPVLVQCLCLEHGSCVRAFTAYLSEAIGGEVCDPPCSAGRVACMQVFDPS